MGLFGSIKRKHCMESKSNLFCALESEHVVIAQFHWRWRQLRHLSSGQRSFAPNHHHQSQMSGKYQQFAAKIHRRAAAENLFVKASFQGRGRSGPTLATSRRIRAPPGDKSPAGRISSASKSNDGERETCIHRFKELLREIVSILHLLHHFLECRVRRMTRGLTWIYFHCCPEFRLQFHDSTIFPEELENVTLLNALPSGAQCVFNGGGMQCSVQLQNPDGSRDSLWPQLVPLLACLSDH